MPANDITKARQLIVAASFGPGALKAIGEALPSFAIIRSAPKGPTSSSRSPAVPCWEDSPIVAALKRAARQRMALDYKRRR